jgi:hypothetical protein
LVIAEAAWIHLARTSASRDAADATVFDQWRPIGWWVHGRIFDGRRRQAE